ncbi:MAG TPA: tetratricopeptide repeat protein [Syntrophales bacterium]|nr:tetratricopeptide repeat protein [Syntrophales bacterium]
MVRNILTGPRCLLFFLLLLLGVHVTGCPAPVRMPPGTVPVTEIPPSEGKRLDAPEDPRTLAAMNLTEQGRMLLERGRVDEAISLFERAANISPANGRNCFYLAEAWILKGDLYQAREWNRLAEIYLREDGAWMEKVLAQKKRIKKGGKGFSP